MSRYRFVVRLLLVTSSQAVYFLVVNPRTDTDFPQRPLSYACCLKFWRLSMKLGDEAILALFDQSAAFDAVDHAIQLRHLHLSYGFNGTVPHWFKSYLCG